MHIVVQKVRYVQGNLPTPHHTPETQTEQGIDKLSNPHKKCPHIVLGLGKYLREWIADAINSKQAALFSNCGVTKHPLILGWETHVIPPWRYKASKHLVQKL